MTKTKWYQKPIYLMVALALVLALGAVVVPMAGTVEASPGTIHVDINDPGCVTGPQPDPYACVYCNIQDAIDDAAPTGDTILVHPGAYCENLLIDKSLTLESYTGNLWDTSIDDIATDAKITIEGDVDVTVQGFDIWGGTHGIYIGPVYSTVNILDCFIHDNNFGGIRVLGGGDLLHIEGNIISQNGVADSECGIHIDQAWNTTDILHNVIGAWWDGEDVGTIYAGNNGDGIRIDDVPVESAVTIEDNFIVDNGDDGIDFSSPTSVHGSVNIEDNVIGARVYDYGAGGVYPFDGNNDNGIHVAHVSDTGSINIEGNAISENGNDGINFGSGVSAIYGTITILQNFIGGWTCYPGDYGHSGSPQRYHGNGDRGIEINQVGDSGASGTVTIEGNKISENHRGAVDETGIYIQNIYGVVTIKGNDIGSWTDRHGASYLGNNGAGILIVNVFSGAELTIGADNSIKKNIGDGIEIQWGQATSDIEIHHNVIDHNGFWDLDRGIKQDSGGVCGIKLGSGGVCGAMVRENIITNHHKGIHLDMDSTQNTIQDNLIRDNAEGIWVDGDNNQILRNDILNNVEAASGVHLTSTALGNIIHCNNIEGNLLYGVYNENADEAVDATNNWWGDAHGPSLSPGSGDKISANVLYDPWLPFVFEYCEQCGGALPPPPAAVPTVNQWGVVSMITLLAGSLVWRLRRRQTISRKG